MRSHHWLVFLMVALLAIITVADPIKDPNYLNDIASHDDDGKTESKLLTVKQKKLETNDGENIEEIVMAANPRLNKTVKINDEDKFLPDPNIPIGLDPRFNKMLPYTQLRRNKTSFDKKLPNPTTLNVKIVTTTTISAPTKIISNTTTNKPSSTTIGIVAIDKKIDATLAEDISHSEISKDDEYEHYYDENDDDDDDDDDDIEEEDYDNDSNNTTQAQRIDNEDKLIPIKIESKINVTVSGNNESNDTIETTDDDDDTTDEEDEDLNDDDDEYDDSDIIDTEDSNDSNDSNNAKEIKTNCPRDCICERNINSFMVATCSRLDIEVQKFDSSITDLQVIDIGPMYPIVLGDEFFKKIGLSSLESIKISNCTIEHISETAFRGLDNLFSVNLTNNGLETIHPDTFMSNLKLRLVSLAGNDLSSMQKSSSPYTKYMLKASSVEELDLSNCNLNQLLPTIFNELKNIVYINLSGNNLKTLPKTIFERVDTIEELDLSNNRIVSLPKMIFNKTSLAILNMKNNDVSTSLEFLTADIQRLDLSYCKITNINNQMFKNLDNLNHLVLKGNDLQKIHAQAFNSLKNLRYIDLSFNSFTELSAMLFLNNPNLDVIKINDNSNLKKLPAEGFETSSGKFKIYLFDVSNCDLTHLSENTFSTMPQLTTLNLSLNNIQYLSKGTFSYLNRLIDLDLSQNLIEEINDLIFLHNRNLNKLKLSGNPIETLSSRTFLPTENLSELDVSDCGLSTIWTESSRKTAAAKVLKNLRVLNVSRNDIGNIYKSDLDIMTNLNVLDISDNPLNCNNEFRTLIKWLSKNKIKTSDPLLGRRNANLKSFFVDDLYESNWDTLARKVCLGIVDSSTEKEEIKDLNDDDTDDYDYTEYYDIPDASDDVKKINDDELFVDAVNAVQNSEDEIMKDQSSSRTIIIDDTYEETYDTERIVFTCIKATWLVFVFVLSIMCIIIIIRKRGERYRQALLASKNSIVYQKLSEDLGPTTTPKLNRYMPINQV